MKTIIFALAAVILSIAIFPQPVHAALDRQPKTITGKVYLPDGSFAEGAMVTVTCAGTILTDTVSQFGNYSVTYPDGVCVQFDPLTVGAQSEGMNATLSTEVVYYKTNTLTDLTFASVVSVPEYGWLTGIMAAGVSILGYSLMRRSLWIFHV